MTQVKDKSGGVNSTEAYREAYVEPDSNRLVDTDGDPSNGIQAPRDAYASLAAMPPVEAARTVASLDNASLIALAEHIGPAAQTTPKSDYRSHLAARFDVDIDFVDGQPKVGEGDLLAQDWVVIRWPFKNPKMKTPHKPGLGIRFHTPGLGIKFMDSLFIDRAGGVYAGTTKHGQPQPKSGAVPNDDHQALAIEIINRSIALELQGSQTPELSDAEREHSTANLQRLIATRDFLENPDSAPFPWADPPEADLKPGK